MQILKISYKFLWIFHIKHKSRHFKYSHPQMKKTSLSLKVEWKTHGDFFRAVMSLGSTVGRELSTPG